MSRGAAPPNGAAAPPQGRGTWASRLGFVLAASGSAVGLGNIWRFPYITGENGGGLFVLVYLACVAAVGLPILIAEILIGRSTQRSTVSAFKALAGRRSAWRALGGLGVVVVHFILSFYSVVAGWALHYTLLAARGGIGGRRPEEIQALFSDLYSDGTLNVVWMTVFMGLTVAIVLRGIHRGIERWSMILMPALLVLLLILLAKAVTLPGFGQGLRFVFGFHAEQLSPRGVVEALGHAFFTLSVGMGGMLTYGSYLGRNADVPRDSIRVAVVDTLIALTACLILFPIAFTFGQEPAQGPGLIFTNLPLAFARMAAGDLLATLFFALLVFAALTSSISLLEVATAYWVDERGWSRTAGTLVSGGLATLLGVPCALAGAVPLLGETLRQSLGGSWFELVADACSNWILPVGGLGYALFVGWFMAEARRRAAFTAGSRLARGYAGWLGVLRWIVPLAVLAVLLHGIGVL